MRMNTDYALAKFAWSLEAAMLGTFVFLCGAFTSDQATAKVGSAIAVWGFASMGILWLWPKQKADQQ